MSSMTKNDETFLMLYINDDHDGNEGPPWNKYGIFETLMYAAFVK